MIRNYESLCRSVHRCEAITEKWGINFRFLNPALSMHVNAHFHLHVHVNTCPLHVHVHVHLQVQ